MILCSVFSLSLLASSAYSAALNHEQPLEAFEAPKDPSKDGNGTYASDYTGAVYGAGSLDVIHASTKKTIGCMDQYAKVVAIPEGVCATYWIWNWEFEVMNVTSGESRGIVSFENANVDKFFPQPDTQDVLWTYDIARQIYITTFWLKDGLVTANDAAIRNRNNVSTFYIAKVPEGKEQVNVTTFSQDVPVSWVWKPDCTKRIGTGETKFCGQNV